MNIGRMRMLKSEAFATSGVSKAATQVLESRKITTMEQISIVLVG